MDINIIIPVLNEELRLEVGILKAVNFLDKHLPNEYILTIIDNGSTDKTQEIAESICKNNKQVKYFRLEEKGVGIALRKGFAENQSDIVGYMDVDLSTDLNHVVEMYEKFKGNSQLDIVTGSRNLLESKIVGRSKLRDITSRGLALMIKIILGGNLNDYMCGFKFFRREKANLLMKNCSNNNGWFYCAELLVVGKWLNYNILEMPIHWVDDPVNSKVNGKVVKLIRAYMREISKLLIEKKKYKK
jgi:glycosyltransferase involved in cell wall biosynthesis